MDGWMDGWMGRWVDVWQVDIVVASVQSLGRKSSKGVSSSSSSRVDKYHGYGGIIMVDEAHHLRTDSSYDRVLRKVGVGSRGTTQSPPPPPQHDVAASSTIALGVNSSRRGPLPFPAGGTEDEVGGKKGRHVVKKLLIGYTATPYR